MPNRSGRAYGLTTLCPLREGSEGDQSSAERVRDFLRRVPAGEQSPMAAVPNSYLCRFFVLDDVIFERHPARLEHLGSKYLVFVAELHGELEPYLEGMWQHAEAFVRELFACCRTFERVIDARTFVAFVKRCQVETTFYFNGSTDQPLAEQLKSLYLKQELSKFAYAQRGKNAIELQRAFAEFVARVAPSDLAGPTWRPGASSPETAAHDPRSAR